MTFCLCIHRTLLFQFAEISKKTNAGYTTAWGKSLINIPEDKKKSFWQKMQRRRITTMLRPTYACMLEQMKKMVKGSNIISYFDICDKDDDENSTLRAEELLLLALHPESSNPPLPPVPPYFESDQCWAEPGWQVVLDALIDRDSSPFSILTKDAEGQLPRKFLSVCSSSGRQAASLIKSRHLRMLTGPLSFPSQASAPAESNPSSYQRASQGRWSFCLFVCTFHFAVTHIFLSQNPDMLANDPISVSEEKMPLGYSFVVRPTISHPMIAPKIDAEGSASENNYTEKRRKSLKADKIDGKISNSSAIKGPNRRRKSQASIEQNNSSSLTSLAIAESNIDSGYGAQLVSKNQPDTLSFQPFQISESVSSASNNIIFRQKQQMHFDQQQADQYRLFLMQQQQQQLYQTPVNQTNFPPSKMQQQQQFQHMMQMRILAQQMQRQQASTPMAQHPSISSQQSLHPPPCQSSQDSTSYRSSGPQSSFPH